MIAYACQGMDFKEQVIVLNSTFFHALLEPFGSTFLSSKCGFIHFCHAAFAQFSPKHDLF